MLSKTAKEVYEQSIVIALNLRRMGIKKGDAIALYTMNNEWVSVLTLGCILVGAVPYFCEVHLDHVSQAQLFDIVHPSIVFYEEKYLSNIEASLECVHIDKLPQLLAIDSRQLTNIHDELLKPPQANIDFSQFESVKIHNTQEEIGILALTSGSTGIPKVVQITHALLSHGISIWWDNELNYEPLNSLDSSAVVFSFSPLRWISQVAVLLQSMLFGLKRVSSCGAPTGKYGFELLRNSDVTHIFVAPSIFYEIILQMDPNDVASLASLKLIQLGGEPPSKIVLEMARRLAVNARTFQSYGMTEMSSCICIDELINGGKPLPGYELQILDDDCQPLGPNQAGQIAVRPPFPLKGYLTIDNKPYYNKQGFFINGDYGLMDDQHKLHILARYKDLIRANGELIIPNSLEYSLINLPEIYVARLASYKVTPEDVNEIGSLFVVLNSNVSLTHEEMSRKIRDTLSVELNPKQLAIIQHIHYVDSVPLTTCGKIDRVALKKLALSKQN
uniref:AMP-dependent synthetase/ligase domain-containing protein n=1 Tax=Stomoxys calcitrans TaxID=35570 RepID=A0A1I8NSR8_STOCA